ncbi:uncharacterized protein LOC129751960 [Uranotaenia lowii]|uniref:uncharacterized protein LOC129751960 n=1 Tax=Uranotaenia lowii TaxID=190385 RepID=UPI002479AB3A|nr:uncharacterized protein LOC129751960 [Uranotaenia lowii]
MVRGTKSKRARDELDKSQDTAEPSDLLSRIQSMIDAAIQELVSKIQETNAELRAEINTLRKEVQTYKVESMNEIQRVTDSIAKSIVGRPAIHKVHRAPNQLVIISKLSSAQLAIPAKHWRPVSPEISHASSRQKIFRSTPAFDVWRRLSERGTLLWCDFCDQFPSSCEWSGPSRVPKSLQLPPVCCSNPIVWSGLDRSIFTRYALKMKRNEMWCENGQRQSGGSIWRLLSKSKRPIAQTSSQAIGLNRWACQNSSR